MEENQVLEIDLKMDLQDAEKAFENALEALQAIRTVAENISTILKSAFTPLENSLQKVKIESLSATAAIEKMNGTVQKLMEQIAATTTWTAICSAATAVTSAFGAAMSVLTSPITLVIAGVAALVAGIVLLIKKWDTVKEVAIRAWEGIKEAFGSAWSWFESKVLNPLVDGVKGGAGYSYWGCGALSGGGALPGKADSDAGHALVGSELRMEDWEFYFCILKIEYWWEKMGCNGACLRV